MVKKWLLMIRKHCSSETVIPLEARKTTLLPESDDLCFLLFLRIAHLTDMGTRTVLQETADLHYLNRKGKLKNASSSKLLHTNRSVC